MNLIEKSHITFGFPLDLALEACEGYTVHLACGLERPQHPHIKFFNAFRFLQNLVLKARRAIQ